MKNFNKLIVRRAPGLIPSNGILSFQNQSYPCLLGKHGITTRKLEGDMKTPAGKFKLLFGFTRKLKSNLGPHLLSFSQIQNKDIWCDDPTNPLYNRPAVLPFLASHELLHRKDRLYDIIIIINHNYSARVKNRGSAIFFHLTAEKPYTAGCIAISPKIMQKILPKLNHKSEMIIYP